MGPETTGKFGTGFLTTHLLSRVVYVSGIFNNLTEGQPMPDEGVKYKRFSLLLDRSPRDKLEMIQKYHEVQ